MRKLRRNRTSPDTMVLKVQWPIFPPENDCLVCDPHLTYLREVPQAVVAHLRPGPGEALKVYVRVKFTKAAEPDWASAEVVPHQFW